MDLEPRCYDSSLGDKNQAFGANLVKFTSATGVVQEVATGETKLLQVKYDCYKRV